MTRLGVAALALGASACAFGPWSIGSAPDPLPTGPVRVRVEVLRGLSDDRPPLSAPRVALLVDATRSMTARTAAGPSRLIGARAAAQRFIDTLDPSAELSLFVLGDDPRGTCGDDGPTPLAGDREALRREARTVRARGEGSLAATLDAIAGPDAGGYARVVAVSGLEDDCGGDLCAAAEALAARGIRLDLVQIGDAPAPDCLDGLAPPGDAAPPGWLTARPAPFHVERGGADPAIVVCGETGGLPVEFAPGKADVVVNLVPPLRVERRFQPGTRWVLQVLDFPGLDPPERQWRWQADDVPGAAEDAAP